MPSEQSTPAPPAARSLPPHLSKRPTTSVPSTALPVWLPPADVGVRTTACGVHFDAVRVCERIGAPALESLAGRTGPVIGDGRDGVYYWLVPVGSADGWNLPSVSVYGAACYVWMPSTAPGHTRWVRWLIAPEPGWDGLTDPEMLHDALTTAVAALHGPRPEAAR